MKKIINESPFLYVPENCPCEVCGNIILNTDGLTHCAEENGHLREHYCCSSCKPIHKEFCFYRNVELEMTNGSWKVFTK